MPRRSAETPDANRTRYLRHRARRAEDEVLRLAGELDAVQAEIAAERAALIAYLHGDGIKLDALEALQAMGREAAREMAVRHQSCIECGGYRREMWDALLEPVITDMREALGVGPDGTPLPDWPVREGYQHWRGLILRPFRTEDEERERARLGEALRRDMQRTGVSTW